ncbi:uncharacterized protein LOC115743846 [Rhodamnia argentea]|uniref:Uncharacterized protein LOC115743846 n=1 Tax=Rhodamnia argentea TaxID=178133 RepID=A0A8B8PJ02_9MYRT|nr:uncharacterized protein LOC115743846 [Rhodamnia argentea]
MEGEQGRSMSESHEQADSESFPSSSSSSRPCPICLSPTPHLQESYLDRCFHKFCYKCIVQWTKVVASKHSEAPSSLLCPFCKTENFSIIHGYDGSKFERHYVGQIFSDSVFFTEAHWYRLRCYYVEPGILGDAFDVKRFWKLRKYLESNRWLYSWLKREIQALMQEEDVDVVVHHMLGTIESSLRRYDQRKLKAPEERQMEFKMLLLDAARPFLTGRTDRFVDEAELFLASGLNLEAYDDVYMRGLGWENPGIDSQIDSLEESLKEPTDDSTVALQSKLFDFDEDLDGAQKPILRVCQSEPLELPRLAMSASFLEEKRKSYYPHYERDYCHFWAPIRVFRIAFVPFPLAKNHATTQAKPQRTGVTKYQVNIL